jgi:hypothetical protein
MLDSVPSRLVAEWRAYAQLEPFGPGRDDLRSGVIASAVANGLISRKGRRRAWGPVDFFPELAGNGEEGEELTPEAQFEAFAAAFRMAGGGAAATE